MNEVFSVAEDNGMKIFYQDTDSCHMLKKNVNILALAYKNKYNRDLIGKNLGQFHSDFPDINGREAYSNKSIFCGKKYISIA
jgi:hypothetical protein